MTSTLRPVPTAKPAAAGSEEERELVRRMRAGDEGAFEEFAAHYIPALLRFAQSRLGSQQDLARDMVQATICKVIEKLDSYRGEAPLYTWLCACCRNEIAMYFRKQQSRPALVAVDEEGIAADRVLVDLSSQPDEVFLDGETESLVHVALDQLPPHYGSVLEWKYLEGASVETIAGRLDLGLKAAESLLTRARNRFRSVYQRLTGRDIES